MRNIIFVVLLVLLAVLPAFSQEDEYAPFQGVWEGIIDEHKNYFIFSNNKFTMFGEEAGTDMIVYGDFSFINDTIKFHFRFGFLFDEDKGWLGGSIPEDNIEEMQFIFSGDKLILAADGEIMILTKM